MYAGARGYYSLSNTNDFTFVWALRDERDKLKAFLCDYKVFFMKELLDLWMFHFFPGFPPVSSNWAIE